MWDSENVRFNAVAKTNAPSEFAVSNQDRITRKNIKNIINTLVNKDTTEYTALYRQEQDAYIVKLNKLLSSTELLRPSDIPSFNYTSFPLQADAYKEVEFYTALPNTKILYEKLGIILSFSDPKFPFTTPSGWTKDIDTSVTLVIEKTSNSLSCVISGYDQTTKSGYYDFEGTQIPLYFKDAQLDL